MKCELCDEAISGKSYQYRLFSFSEDKITICEECYLETEEYEAVGEEASRFWEIFHDTHKDLPHICDFSIKELSEKHKNVLALRDKYDPWLIGLLLGAECYDSVWTSRSCSEHLADLIGVHGEKDEVLGDTDYLEYYCGSSNYFDFMFFHPDRRLLKDFEDARKVDYA